MHRRHENNNNENNNKRNWRNPKRWEGQKQKLLIFLFFLVFLVFATRTQRTTTTTTVFDGEAERENQTPETRREGVFLKGSRSGEDWRGGLEWREKSREMFTRPRERFISERNSRERATRFVYDVRRRGGKGRFRVHHDIVANCRSTLERVVFGRARQSGCHQRGEENGAHRIDADTKTRDTVSDERIRSSVFRAHWEWENARFCDTGC